MREKSRKKKKFEPVHETISKEMKKNKLGSKILELKDRFVKWFNSTGKVGWIVAILILFWFWFYMLKFFMQKYPSPTPEGDNLVNLTMIIFLFEVGYKIPLMVRKEREPNGWKIGKNNAI